MFLMMARSSSIGVCKDNGLMKAVNAAIAAAKEDGSLRKISSLRRMHLQLAETSEGLLDDNGEAAEASTEIAE